MEPLANNNRFSTNEASAKQRGGIRPMLMALAAIAMAAIVFLSPFAMPFLLQIGLARMLQYRRFVYPPNFNQRLIDNLLGTVAIWALIVCVPFTLFACVQNLKAAHIQRRSVQPDNWYWIPFLVSAAAVAFTVLGLLVIAWELGFAIE